MSLSHLSKYRINYMINFLPCCLNLQGTLVEQWVIQRHDISGSYLRSQGPIWYYLIVYLSIQEVFPCKTVAHMLISSHLGSSSILQKSANKDRGERLGSCFFNVVLGFLQDVPDLWIWNLEFRFKISQQVKTEGRRWWKKLPVCHSVNASGAQNAARQAFWVAEN